MRDESASMAGPQNSRSSGPAGSDRVRSLSNSRYTANGQHSADGEVDVDRRLAAERRAVAANSTAVAGMKPPPKPDDGDQRGEAAEDEDDGLGS